MNLNNIANGAIQGINPNVSVTIKQSTGYSTQADGTQTPTYKTITGTGNKQPLSAQDLKRIEGLNTQSVTAKVFFNGNYEGVVRKDGKGGDLLIISSETFLVTAVLERWPSWCSLGVTEQLS